MAGRNVRHIHEQWGLIPFLNNRKLFSIQIKFSGARGPLEISLSVCLVCLCLSVYEVEKKVAIIGSKTQSRPSIDLRTRW